jgi:hypothetical protein
MIPQEPNSVPATPQPKALRRSAASLAALAALLPLLSGCASVTGSPSTAQVRIIDCSPDTPGIDVYQGSGVLAYNLGFGTLTSYIPTSQGTFSITSYLTQTRQQLASVYGTFLAGSQYTVLVSDASTALQETVLKDQSIPAPSGQVSVRVVDQSDRNGAVDLYLIPSGSTITQVKPILTSISFGSNTGYINIPYGTYTLSALPAGTVPTSATATSYTSPATYYPNGSARTLVLIDQQLITTPGLQVVVAADYDSVGTPN